MTISAGYLPWAVLLFAIVPLGAPGDVAAQAGTPAAAEQTSSSLLVLDVRTGRIPGRSRVVFDLSGPPRYRTSMLHAPERIVIELENARLEAPVSPRVFVGTPVAQLRSSQEPAGALRIVLQLEGTSVRHEDFILENWDGQKNRLVLDLYPQDPAAEPEPEPEPEPEQKAAPGPPAIIPAPPSAREPAATPAPDAPAPVPPGIEVGFSGILEQEWAYGSARNRNQKFETLLKPRLDAYFGNRFNLTAIGRIRLDAVGDLGPSARRPANYSGVTRPWFNHERAELSLHEFHVDFRVGQSDWRLGKQQVIWGQADGIKVLDVLNPQSFREFILDDFDNSRIPLWMANITVPVGDVANLQLLWIPDTTYHEQADPGTPYAASSPRLIPPLPITALAEVDKPDDPFTDGDIGFQLSGFVGDWDLGVNYLYHYLDTPALPVRMLPTGQLQLAPDYRRSHLVGGTVSTLVGGLTLRGELAYLSDTFQPTTNLNDEAVGETPEVSSVIGLDWMPQADSLLSAQWFHSYLRDHDSAMARDSSEHLLTVLYQQDFANAVWRFRALGIYSPNDGDSLLQLNLLYWASSSLKLWLGADVFYGSRRGLFGQFDSQDRLLLGLEYGF